MHKFNELFAYTSKTIATQKYQNDRPKHSMNKRSTKEMAKGSIDDGHLYKCSTTKMTRL